jgi:hypothetical protein
MTSAALGPLLSFAADLAFDCLADLPPAPFLAPAFALHGGGAATACLYRRKFKLKATFAVVQ